MNVGDYFVVNTGNGWEAQLIRWATQSTVNHAGVYIGDNKIVEAQPGGAVISHVGKYPKAIWSKYPLTSGERSRIEQAALQLVGVGYNWLDIVAIGLAQRRLGGVVAPKSWVFSHVQNYGLICSQLVDVTYLSAGVHLFQDGRLPGDVSPGDLLTLIQKANH